MSTPLRRRSAALLLFGIGFVLAAALGPARPASAAAPPCHAAGGEPAQTPPSRAPAPCGAVLPLLCCGDRTLPGAAAASPAAGVADLAFLPASPASPAFLVRDALACRGGGTARAAPPPIGLCVLRL